MNTRDLLIYHPGTGTVISLNDIVYLIDASELDEETLDELENGVSNVSPQFHKGYSLDKYGIGGSVVKVGAKRIAKVQVTFWRVGKQ